MVQKTTFNTVSQWLDSESGQMLTWSISMAEGILAGLAVVSAVKALMIVFNMFPDIDVTFLNTLVGYYTEYIYAQ